MVDDTFASMKRAKMVRKKNKHAIGVRVFHKRKPLPKGMRVLHEAIPSKYEKTMLTVKRQSDAAEERLSRRMRELKTLED